MKLLLLIFLTGSLNGFAQTGATRRDLWSGEALFTRAAIDTLPSTILITHKPPSFTHAINGYCIYQGGICTGKHLRYWRKRWVRIGPEYTVWGCKRVNTLKK
jgi:hypothetical protein